MTPTHTDRNSHIAGMLRYYARRLRAWISRPREVPQTRPVIVSTHCTNPILVLGMHRSGTTLLRLILDSHPSIACPPETFFLKHFVHMASDPMTRDGLHGLGFASIDDQRSLLRESATVAHEAYRLAVDKPRWADKTPQYLELAEPLLELLGAQTQVIVVVRDPLEIATSIYKRRWRLVEDGPEDPLDNALTYVKTGVQQLRELLEPPRPLFQLRYEELVREPEHVLRGCFEFLGEPWDPRVLRFNENPHNFGVGDPVARGSATIAEFAPSSSSVSRTIYDRMLTELASERRLLGY